MNLEQLAEQINEDLTRRVVPMDELRVGVRDGKFAVIGSSAMRLPNGWKYSTPQEIGSMVAIFDDPDEGAQAVEELLQHFWRRG